MDKFINNLQKTFNFQVEESFRDDVTVPVWYNTLFLSIPKDMFTQFLHVCFESDLLSVSLLFQCALYGPDCITLCWDEETCVIKFPLKVLWMCWYQNTVQVGSALHVSVSLAPLARQPLTTVLVSCTLQISKCITSLHEQAWYRPLRAVMTDCSRGGYEVLRAIFLRMGSSGIWPCVIGYVVPDVS